MSKPATKTFTGWVPDRAKNSDCLYYLPATPPVSESDCRTAEVDIYAKQSMYKDRRKVRVTITIEDA